MFDGEQPWALGLDLVHQRWKVNRLRALISRERAMRNFETSRGYTLNTSLSRLSRQLTRCFFHQPPQEAPWWTGPTSIVNFHLGCKRVRRYRFNVAVTLQRPHFDAGQSEVMEHRPSVSPLRPLFSDTVQWKDAGFYSQRSRCLNPSCSATY